jgi:hypothetical protein
MSVKKDSVVVFIHPLHAWLNKWLVRMLARKNVRMVCMIGDINGFKGRRRFYIKKRNRTVPEIQILYCAQPGDERLVEKTGSGSANTDN